MTNQLFLLSMPGGSEWILIVIAVLVLFGGRKIPEFMKGLEKECVNSMTQKIM